MLISFLIPISLLGGFLYRIRGGLFGKDIGSTQLARLIWAVPTGLFLSFLFPLDFWNPLLFTLALYLSLALFGHGAHGPMSKEAIGIQKERNLARTELLTGFWLPKIGIPIDSIPFNFTGMAAIGMVRNAMVLIPVGLDVSLVTGLVWMGCGGILAALSYLIGYQFAPHRWANGVSEFMVGMSFWGLALLVF